MPNNPSQKKRLRQSRERRARNREVRSEIRTRTKRLLEMDSPEDAGEALSTLYSAIDRAARRRVIAPKAADRQKARAARHVASLSEG